MGAQYIARVPAQGSKGATHTIRDGWSYSRISDARTGCGIKGPLTVEHMASGRPLEVTCRRPGCTGSD